MKLKNRTSSVPAARTVSRIEDLLAQAGASSVRKDYEAGEVSALTFLLRTADGHTLAVRLPADVAAAERVLAKGRRLTEPQRRNVAQQARRTAWKLMQDWLECQLSLIAMGQAEPAQVFLSYMVTPDGRTAYEMLKGGGFPQLSHHEGPP